MVNIALGAKLLWRLVIGDNDWWKRAICQRYLTRDKRRSLDSSPDRQAGSPIWKLIWASLAFFQESLIWILRNEKKINVWDDRFSASDILREDLSLAPLRQWFTSQGKSSLFDISNWHSNGAWKGWNLGPLPHHLTHVAQSFLLLLNGAALVHL